MSSVRSTFAGCPAPEQLISELLTNPGILAAAARFIVSAGTRLPAAGSGRSMDRLDIPLLDEGS